MGTSLRLRNKTNKHEGIEAAVRVSSYSMARFSFRGYSLRTVVDDVLSAERAENSLLRYRLFQAWLGAERVTGQGVYWNTVFSSAAAQLQYSRNIVLLCGCSPRPAPQFYSKRPPTSPL